MLLFGSHQINPYFKQCFLLNKERDVLKNYEITLSQSDSRIGVKSLYYGAMIWKSTPAKDYEFCCEICLIKKKKIEDMF